jgi:hypothetical protein
MAANAEPDTSSLPVFNPQDPGYSEARASLALDELRVYADIKISGATRKKMLKFCDTIEEFMSAGDEDAVEFTVVHCIEAHTYSLSYKETRRSILTILMYIFDRCDVSGFEMLDTTPIDFLNNLPRPDDGGDYEPVIDGDAVDFLPNDDDSSNESNDDDQEPVREFDIDSDGDEVVYADSSDDDEAAPDIITAITGIKPSRQPIVSPPRPPLPKSEAAHK